jgi:UDP-galactopyranose mutase
MYLIVGAGLSGAVIAERIASCLGERVTVIDHRKQVGGNIYDYKDANGITAHKYGPHAFHTNDAGVWEYLSRFTDWEPYFHRVEAVVDGIDIPLPFNFNSIDLLFAGNQAGRLIDGLTDVYGRGKSISIKTLLAEPRFKELALYVYEKVFKGYSLKQWGLSLEALDESVMERVPVVTSRDNRYFHDKYQAVPGGGYTRLIEKMLDSPLIELELDCPFRHENIGRYKKIIYTGMIDQYFDYVHGALPYRSLRFEMKTKEVEFYQRTAQKNYPENFDFTRITEFKHFLQEKSPVTTICLEFPQDYAPGANEAFYPVNNPASYRLYQQYELLASAEKNTVFLGRLAQYRYLNMDQVVRLALDRFLELAHGR